MRRAVGFGLGLGWVRLHSLGSLGGFRGAVRLGEMGGLDASWDF